MREVGVKTRWKMNPSCINLIIAIFCTILSSTSISVSAAKASAVDPFNNATLGGSRPSAPLGWPTRSVGVHAYDERILLNFHCSRPQPPRHLITQREAHSMQLILAQIQTFALQCPQGYFIPSRPEYFRRGKTFSLAHTRGEGPRQQREVDVTLFWGVDVMGIKREVLLATVAWLHGLLGRFVEHGMWEEIQEGQVMFMLQAFPFHTLGWLEIRVKDEGQGNAAHAAKG